MQDQTLPYWGEEEEEVEALAAAFHVGAHFLLPSFKLEFSAVLVLGWPLFKVWAGVSLV